MPPKRKRTEPEYWQAVHAAPKIAKKKSGPKHVMHAELTGKPPRQQFYNELRAETIRKMLAHGDAADADRRRYKKKIHKKNAKAAAKRAMATEKAMNEAGLVIDTSTHKLQPPKKRKQ